ncbi:MAG TPA: V-type ATP synthase subunit A [Anaerolineae bacterium]|nr:V-type ATP synthase subunit A [Anaerolineae bacterium]HQI86101.1 V-type ATP synthase subunit A [Anaerolineae bacterium]
MSTQIGEVIWINGPVIRARGSQHIGMLEVVEVGDEHLIGEIIGLERDVITVQVYEETSGLRPGAPVFSTGYPLSVELGPGLLQSIFDGIQRPLPVLELRSGAFIGRGIKTTPLYRKQKWTFTPRVQVGERVQGGALLGTTPETTLIEHRVLTPPEAEGTLTWVAPKGEYTIVDPIARLQTPRGEQEITMLRRWPVRRPRPYRRRLPPTEMLVTGQRVLDTFFPLVKGGTAAIPGGFGAGKTITQHQVAKWSDADVVIYVGCGERGNEMTEVLQEFPELVDPRSGRSLMERTILIANTSNMPVAAREASVYTGITLAEYYRDMGYHVAIMADSTSRWAEALREISGRLEEMPAEEGYPAYLAARLAEFYERAGRTITLSGAEGSVSIIGAVSPPGGDFSEPVTQHTKRFIRCFWALDKSLASARHFPAINWLDSYSEYVDEVVNWWQSQGYADWYTLRTQAMEILQRESRLQQIVKLVGPDALPDDQRLILETARLLREGILQQSALDAIDAYAAVEKQIRMLRAILHYHDRAARIVAKGCPIILLHNLPIVNTLVRMKTNIPNDNLGQMEAVMADLDTQMDQLEREYA